LNPLNPLPSAVAYADPSSPLRQVDVGGERDGDCLRHNSRKPEPWIKTCGGAGSAGVALALGLLGLLSADPGVGEVRDLGHEQQVVTAERVGVLPLLAVLLETGEGDVVTDPAVGVVLPDGGLDRP